MFALAGSYRGGGAGGGRDRLRHGEALAEASLDNVALRDPKATDHKMTFAELAEAGAALRLGGLLRRRRHAARAT